MFFGERGGSVASLEPLYGWLFRNMLKRNTISLANNRQSSQGSSLPVNYGSDDNYNKYAKAKGASGTSANPLSKIGTAKRLMVAGLLASGGYAL